MSAMDLHRVYESLRLTGENDHLCIALGIRGNHLE